MPDQDPPADAPDAPAQAEPASGPKPDASGRRTPDDASKADVASGSAKPDDVSNVSKPDPDPVAAATASGRRVRLMVLGVAAAIAAILVIGIVRSNRRGPDGSVASTTDGGTAVSAPKRPTLPGDPVNGVRLSGFVVDGTNAPVIGAVVTAELERGAIDRGLTGPTAGGGSARAGSAGSALGAGSAGAGSAGAGSAGAGSAGAGSAGAGSAGAGSAGAGSAPGAGPAAGSAGAGSGSDTSGIHAAGPTATDGRFLVDVPIPGRYRLRVTGPGLIPAELRYVPVPSDEARIVIARRVSVEGTVVDAGSPVANATVGLRGEAIGGGIEAKTDAKGAFQFQDLPEGRYQLFAWRDTLAARAVRVNRLGAGPFPPIELSLEAAAIVVGRVVDRDGGAGLIAAIELRPSGDDQAPRYARSASDGTFRIEGVPHGRWIADAFAPGYITSGGVELEAGRGIPELQLDRGGVIEGRIVTREGTPIANANVRALTSGAATPQEHSAAVDQDRLRRFSGRIAAPAAVLSLTVGTSADPQLLPRGELGVMVGPIPPIPPPGAQVARPAAIDTSVAGSLVGEPAPLAESSRGSIWTTGSDGRYRISGLPKGKHVVLAIAPSFAEGRSKPAAVDLAQVVADVDITLGPGTMIFGRVVDHHGVRVSGAQLHARPEVGNPVDAFTDEDGNYRLGPVTGQVELTASAFGHADVRRMLEIALATGSAPDDRREDFSLVVADAVLAGTLDDATGAPVGAAQIEVIAGAGGGRRAVVNPDGTFSIDHLPVGALRVRVTHPSYPTVELDTTASSGDRAKVRLRLPLGGAVEGVLLDDTSGTPMPGLVISGYGPSGATADATSEATGRWKLGPLRPGRWKLVIEQPGYLPISREVEVPASRIPGETSVHDIRFDLAKGALLGGTVRDARGRRVTGATVTVQTASNPGTATGTTDTQGEFRIRDAPTGDLTITATAPEGRGTTTVTVRPGDEILGLSIELR